MGRVAAALVGLVIVAAGVGGLILFLQSRDEAGVEASGAGPGQLEPDLGSAHEGRAEPGAVSGPHQPANVAADRTALSPDQLLHALEQGNVVFTYPGAEAPPELVQIQRDLSGRFDAELAASGLSVILAPGERLEALAWRHRLPASDPSDPQLRAFAEHWLGAGARGR